MAQTKAKEIRDAITTALDGELGTYTLTNGSTIPAIYVVPPQLPSEWKVSGLECVIGRSPEHQSNPIFKNSLTATQLTETWIAHLTQWDTNKTTQDAREKIIRTFPNSTNILQAQTETTYERVTFRIQLRDLLRYT